MMEERICNIPKIRPNKSPAKNITHDICHHIFMYDGIDKNTNSQTNSSTKHILNTYGGAQNEIYCN